MRRTSYPTLSFLAVAIVLALAVLSPLHKRGSQIVSESQALSELPGTLEQRNSNAFAKILGEIRMGAADYMFTKTELYLHGGIGYAPHTDIIEGINTAPSGTLDGNGSQHVHGEGEAPSSTDAVPTHKLPSPHSDHSTHEAGDASLEGAAQKTGPQDVIEHESEHEHGGEEHIATLIRGKSEDFRGILGDLEREVQPWRDPESPHLLTGGAELLPWFRLMTISNPHFVRGYRIGAMWLGREHKFEEAQAFLNEGIANNSDNPELFQLYLSKVQLLIRAGRLESHANLDAALQAAREGFKAGLARRPEGGETGKIKAGLLWTADHEEDLLFLARFEVMILERQERFDEAKEALRRNIALFPYDETLTRLQERLDAGASPYQNGQPAN